MDELINLTGQALENLQKFIFKNQIAVIDIETTGLNSNPQNSNVDYPHKLNIRRIETGRITTIIKFR